jgi:membrane-bound lytic murein transglycosylase D
VTAIELIPRASRQWIVSRILNGCGVLCMAALGACSTLPKPLPATAPLEQSQLRDAAADPIEPATAGGPVESDAEVAPVAETDPWLRIRSGARFTRCEALPSVERQIERYRREGPALRAQLERVLPRIEYVLRALEDAGLPAEFALLPLVESGYRPVPATGNRPAGIWQFMPATARSSGLRVGAAYDGRLDLAQSTTAAIHLLTRLGEGFEHDWLLVNMAYNAGEFRVRRALARSPAASADTLWQDLPLSRTTHAHLARLIALSCVIERPALAGISLPTLAPGQRLAAVPLDAPIDLALAARLARIDELQLRGLNPAHAKPSMQPGDRLLLPETALPNLEQGLALLPPAKRVGWRPGDGRAASDWSAVATAEVDAATLAAVHGLRIGDPLPATVLLPPAAARSPQLRVHDSEAYVVRTGDSLWSIARRLGVGMRELATTNGIPLGKQLQPGQVLRIPAPP